jgi:hypothetical protein
MKRFLFLILLLIPCLANAQWQEARMGPAMVGGSGVAAASTLYCSSSTSDGTTTWLRCEDYEGTGSCDTGTGDECWGTWVCGGTQQSACGGAYTTAPCDAGVPIEGINSIYLDATGTCTNTVTATTPIYGFFKVRFDVYAGANDPWFQVLDASDNVLMYLYSTGGGTPIIRLGCGTGTNDGATTIAVDTTYNVWWDYTAEAGVDDGVAHVYLSTNSTKGSAQATVTTCSVAGTPAKIQLKSVDAGVEHIFDRIRVSASDITGVP